MSLRRSLRRVFAVLLVIAARSVASVAVWRDARQSHYNMHGVSRITDYFAAAPQQGYMGKRSGQDDQVGSSR